MPTKIKRSLFIGLGGTGMTALLHTKRMFIDTYGEVPPMIGFLGIDTDGDWYNRVLISKYGEVKLEPSEQLPIQVTDARPIYDVNRDKFTWLPEKNLGSLTSMRLGAGQIRSNGRFAFTVNYDNVKVKIADVINQITAARHIDNTAYDLLGEAEVEIHMVFSVAGGTGSGTFINMAYTIREVAPHCKLMGYAVLPEVFRAMSGTTMQKVKANGYGAILDLDWFMHQGIGKEPFELQYLRNSQMAADRPFNTMVFVDNKNKNGDTYDHVDKLTEMISLGLVTAAGQLSQASASVNDNLEKRIRDGEMDIETKKAWAGGMGASEIVFRGEDLSDIYALKAANWIIEDLLNTRQGSDMIVNGWIDSPEVKIRENNGFDNVIDFMLDKNPKYAMSTINDPQNAQAEIDGYVASCMPKDDDLSNRCTELQARVEQQFHAMMQREINKPSGVGTTEKVLTGLQSQMDIMMREMRSEREALLLREPAANQAVKAAVNDLMEYDKKLFKRAVTLDAKKQDAMAMAYQLTVIKREVKRRDAAIQFYTFMNNLLANGRQRLQGIRKKLEDVYRDNSDKLATIQNRINSEHQMFQIDLAQSHVTQLSVSTDEININDLLRSMPDDARFYGIADLSNQEVGKILFDYAKTINGARRWSDMTIDEILNEMKEDDFERLVQMALRKSEPLFTYNHCGYTPAQQPIDIYFLGVPSANCRINKEYIKERIKGTSDVDESIIGMKNRVIIYRQLGVVPAYAIASLPSCELEYNNCRTNCHIDYGLQLRMRREEFSLKPTLAVDNALELWVRGLIFGLIKNEAGCYYYQNTEDSDAALDDYWIKLSPYRDEAFNIFRRNRSTIEQQYDDYFTQLQREKGDQYLNQVLADAKSNYFDKYSSVKMTREEIKRHGNEAILRLVTDELNYVKNQL